MGEHVTRRSFMVRTIGAVFAFIGGIMAVVLGKFAIVPALKKRKSEWSDAGTVDMIENEPHERRFFEVVKNGWQSVRQERSAWIVKKNDGNFVAFSANCPHLGCGYRWIADRNRFECPCHGSIFDMEGRVISGPAPRPLDTMPTKVENGRLFVQYEVFQLGTTKKITA